MRIKHLEKHEIAQTVRIVVANFTAMPLLLGVILSEAFAGVSLDGNYSGGKYYYQVPIDSHFLTMRITYTNNFSMEYPWRVYPGIRHGSTTSGYSGYSAEFSLGPNLNEGGSQSADWDAEFPSVNPYPYYRYKDVPPGTSWTITLGVWNFSGPIVRIDGGVGIDSTSEATYRINFFDPGSTPGLSAEHPILPEVGEAGFHFDLPLEMPGAGTSYPIYVDPPVAVGYEYTVSSGPNFASVFLPNVLPGGDQDFELSVDGIHYALSAGIPFDLTRYFPGGVDSFTITGIDLDENLDPSDPTAFVTGLTFVGGGTSVAFDMTPIVEIIPEPSALVLLSMVFIGLIASCRSHPRPAEFL